VDSLEAEQVRLIAKKRGTINSRVRETAPPSYRFLASFLESSDPLQSETQHASIGKLRSTVQASRALYRIERARGAEKALNALKKVVRVIKSTRRQNGGGQR